MLKRLGNFATKFTPSRYLRGSKYIGAGALVFDPDGNLLLIKSRLRNAWEYPAGGADGDESPLETCRREVGEEVGLVLDDYQLVGIDFWHKLTPNGNLLFTFSTHVTAAQATAVKVQDFEVKDWRWATRDEALKLMPERLRPRLTQLLAAYDAGKPVYLHTGHPVVESQT